MRRDQRPYNLAYYWSNRAAEIARVDRRRVAAIALMRKLREVPCADCGRRFPPFVMDFDHREPSARSLWIARRAGSVSAERLRNELAKCDVVCANCHRARTYRRAVARRDTRTANGSVPRSVSRRRREQTELLRRLRDVPCADCALRVPFYAMDFDHRVPGDKSFEVPRMLGRVGTDRLLEEVNKCDIVCANCHRIRTFVARASRSNSDAGVL